jgi:hypothetical protein
VRRFMGLFCGAALFFELILRLPRIIALLQNGCFAEAVDFLLIEVIN